MSNHTPGPWSINDWPQDTSDIRIGAVGTPRIASIHLRDVSINEQKANAQLIAKAPELLTLVEQSLRFLREDEYPAFRQQLRDILVEITGEQA